MGTVNSFPITTVLFGAAAADLIFKSTSTTSVDLDTASVDDTVTFETQDGRSFPIGSYVVASSDADGSDFIIVKVTSYADGELAGTVQRTGGSGAHADWTIQFGGADALASAEFADDASASETAAAASAAAAQAVEDAFTDGSIASLAIGGATLGTNVLAVGVDGEDTRAQFMGKVGNYITDDDTGEGIVGIGVAPMHGVSLYVRDNFSNILDGERTAVNFTIVQNPTSAVVANTGVFGELILSAWKGSVDNSTTALFNGTQITAQLQESASVKLMQGVEAVAQHIGTGSAFNGWGLTASVKNQSTGTITNGYAGVFAVDNSGGGTVTNAHAIHILASKGTNVHAIHIDNQNFGTSENYAIWTDTQGLVHFGGAVDAASLTTNQLLGTGGSGQIKIGNDNPVLVEIRGQAGQTTDLFDIKAGGTNVFRVTSAGSISVTADSTFSGAILFSTGTRIDSSVGAQFASSLGIKWSSTSAYTGTKDTGLNRNAAGVVEVNNGTAGTLRDLLVRSVIQTPPASVTPGSNGQMVVQLTSDTSLTFKVKGSDGTVRSGSITLA